MTNPQPGDFGLTQISGQVGKLIRFGQWLNGDGFHDYEHAFIYIGPEGQIVEAEPGGARIGDYHGYANVVWSTGYIDFDGATRDKIVAAAISYIGTPYSFADYFALAALRLNVPHILLDKYVKSSKHMICSQLVAKCDDDAGAPLFDCFTGDVTPGDLYNLRESKGSK